jgi:hypothetical protein
MLSLIPQSYSILLLGDFSVLVHLSLVEGQAKRDAEVLKSMLELHSTGKYKKPVFDISLKRMFMARPWARKRYLP